MTDSMLHAAAAVHRFSRWKQSFLWSSLAIFLLPAQAQTVFRCANAYSHVPCPGAVEVNADDPRSAAQRQASDAATQRDVNAVKALEAERLKQEKLAAAQETAARKKAEKAEKAKQASDAKAAKKATAKDAHARRSKKSANHAKKPDYFVATVDKPKAAPDAKPKADR